MVVSVAEVWLPPPARDEVLDDTFPLQIPAGLKRARAHAAQIVNQAQELAASGSKRVAQIFPRWQVGHRAVAGSPAHEILNLAQEWEPHLIVVGSHGRTAAGRFVLGSVSQKVLTEAQTSVRIARQTTGTGASAIRVVVGVDGSAGANSALRTVAARGWSEGSEVRIIVAEDTLAANSAYRLFPPIDELIDEVNEAERTTAEGIAEEAVKVLRAELENKSVTVSSAVVTGDPKQVLVRHAEEFGADCIFTGATGFSNPIERFLVGSVSAAVAARAHCSVEVVRARRDFKSDRDD
ncbi:MAG TPA: universal stress protein [Pyrinomonadaceae bacterium]|nr:universal stress protein [Pyrinomonadaceae bacterium]